jgi:hypothetical protein
MRRQSLVVALAALVVFGGLAFALVVVTKDSGEAVLIATSLVGDAPSLTDGPLTLPGGQVIDMKCGIEAWVCLPIRIHRDGTCTLVADSDRGIPEASLTYQCPKGTATPVPAAALSALGDP